MKTKFKMTKKKIEKRALKKVAKSAAKKIEKTIVKKVEKVTAKKPDKLLGQIIALLKDRKAEHLVMLDFTGSSFYTENFLIATAQSSSHLDSLQAEIKKLVHEKNGVIYAQTHEGRTGWNVMDLGASIIHLFLKETRELYDLENLWGDLPRTDL